MGLIISSSLYALLAFSIRTLPGTTRFLKSSLFPQSLIKFGKRYLVLHDTSTRTISFLSSAFRSTIEAGARVVLKSPATWLVEGLSHNDSRFNEWAENGKFVKSSAGSDDKKSGNESLSDKFGLSQTATVFVRELGRQEHGHPARLLDGMEVCRVDVGALRCLSDCDRRGDSHQGVARHAAMLPYAA